MITVTLPGLPPALNHAYQHTAGGGKRRSRASVEWQDSTRLLIRNALAWAEWRPAPKSPLAVTVHLTAPNCYAWDCDGRLKLLLDVLMPALGTDDRYIVALTVTKARAAAPATVVTVAVAGEGT